jgi:tetratricopeptide (TPR) repeat protein
MIVVKKSNMSARLDSLKELLQDDPNDGFVLFAVAKEYEGMDDLEHALEFYERLRTVDPEYVGLYYHLGALYAEIEEPEKAMNVYKKGIEVATTMHDLHALSELKGAKMNLELEM